MKAHIESNYDGKIDGRNDYVSNGLQHGLWISYWSNEYLMLRRTWSHGKVQGHSRWWHNTNELLVWVDANYDDDICEGEYIEYDNYKNQTPL